MIPTRAQIEALSEAQFRVLWRDVSSVGARRAHKGVFRRADSIPARIAALQIGESILFPEWHTSTQFCVQYKQYARLRLDDAEANWSAKLTNHGIRVTRTR